MVRRICLMVACAAMGAGVLAGCHASAVNPDARTTFLDSDDMVRMTNQMAQSIIADPLIAQEAAKGPLRIVIKPVINETNEIITDNRKELFVARLQGLLAANPALRDRFIWVMNRDDFEKLRSEEIPEAKLGPTENQIQPDFALYAHFLADTNATNKGRYDMYLCQYKLTRLSGGQSGVELWTGQYETSKHVKKQFLD